MIRYATKSLINLYVIFLRSLCPNNEPITPEEIEKKANDEQAERSIFIMFEEQTLNLVKSTKDEMTTVVPMKTSFFNPVLIRKALLSAP